MSIVNTARSTDRQLREMPIDERRAVAARYFAA